jgi:hypothetical protein
MPLSIAIPVSKIPLGVTTLPFLISKSTTNNIQR